MASLADVTRAISALPEVNEGVRHGHRTWSVAGKAFASQTPPAEPILAVRVDDLGEKEAVLAAGHPGFFTIPHFNGYAAVLIELGRAAPDTVRDALTDGYLACAPAPLAQRFLDNGD